MSGYLCMPRSRSILNRIKGNLSVHQKEIYQLQLVSMGGLIGLILIEIEIYNGLLNEAVTGDPNHVPIKTSTTTS